MSASSAVLRDSFEDLALANHILAHQHVLDGFGHVSMRHPERPDHYLLARNMAPERVTADDILELDLDSRIVTQGEHRSFLERFIHGEIYAARPEVMGIVHSHSHSVLPLGVTTAAPLRSVCHMGGFLGVATPVFEIRDVRGDETDLLISDAGLGKALAGTLGDSAAVLMRGHGVTVVGISLRQAVFRAVYTEINARIQLQAMAIGPVNYLTEAEGRAAAATNDGQMNRAWDLWCEQAKRARAGQ
ncbi:HCOMODA/2-hydroxy-3-carboxy-muconic semialdehyde decarboxylase [Sphingomonas vulcanisoli]|uniref:HCOMODA/2-hydroxy-3-carboxy-muconic semialdehyde decarboxylase n=1 Tax=Sphingomonas vulcanisoli TaxID=1658060 RepID=A0ABX0TZR0_9SPHN|nr:class II aldolase/adducin family protein [Sphingomonas vulcanisoli]NIJ09235.1 HCOMODA/2-hydroxy-3-carboxy-muconic semialdehyde decarboxylase [Sphingomonas vulcanisoli]